MQMTPDRVAQLLGAFVEDKIRTDGVNFKQNVGRRLTAFTTELNERYKFNPPLKEAEVAELYLNCLMSVMEKYGIAIAEKFGFKLEQIDGKIEAVNPHPINPGD